MSVRRRLPDLPDLPRSRADLRLVARVSRLVLSVPRYALLAAAVGWALLTAISVSQNATLVADVVVGGALPLGSRLVVLAEQYPFVGTTFTAVEGAVLVGIAALSGVNAAVATYHFREHVGGKRAGAGAGGGAVGAVLGMLGAGCAACGTAVLAGLLSLVGGSGLLLALPLEGLEFALAALVPLSLSLFWLADGFRGGEVAGCPVEL